MKNIIREIKKSIKIKRISDLFRTDVSENTKIFHSNYLFSFLIEFILFFCLSIYLYKSSKYYNKILKIILYQFQEDLKKNMNYQIFCQKQYYFDV